MRKLEELTVSNPKFSVVVPLDDIFQEIMVRDRDIVTLWLNGMVSPYSIALAAVDARLKTGDRNDSHLPAVFEWLNGEGEKQLTIKYIRRLTDVLEMYVVPILAQEYLTLDNIRLVNAEEMTINEWSCGYVTLTFDVHRQGPPRDLIGTPHPIWQPVVPPVVSYPAPVQVPFGGVQYNH